MCVFFVCARSRCLSPNRRRNSAARDAPDTLLSLLWFYDVAVTELRKCLLLKTTSKSGQQVELDTHRTVASSSWTAGYDIDIDRFASSQFHYFLNLHLPVHSRYSLFR
uniref:(northern house mosquito) hypothetical protein n=1 Tax=Culex pipiens TaxID=7175 RepID=A0A8D8I533_CULPI